MLQMDNITLIKDKLKQVHHVFFDLDGTLIDTEKLYFRFWKEASKFYGYELKDEEALNLRSIDKKTGQEYLREVSHGVLNYDLTRNKRIELMDEYLSNHEIELKNGVREFLDKLFNEGKKLYIVSANKVEKSIRILSALKIDKYFTDILSSKDVKRGKPFPDIYVYACSYLNIKNNDVVVFEDSPNGLRSSFDAGIFTIMIEDLTHFDPSMDYLNAFFSDFSQLI